MNRNALTIFIALVVVLSVVLWRSWVSANRDAGLTPASDSVGIGEVNQQVPIVEAEDEERKVAAGRVALDDPQGPASQGQGEVSNQASLVGTVTYSDNSPAAGLRVLAYDSADAGGVGALGSKRTDEGGAFRIPIQNEPPSGAVRVQLEGAMRGEYAYELKYEVPTVNWPPTEPVEIVVEGGVVKFVIHETGGGRAAGATLRCATGPKEGLGKTWHGKFHTANENGVCLVFHDGLGFISAYATSRDGVYTSVRTEIPLGPGGGEDIIRLELNQLHPCSLKVYVEDEFGVPVAPLALRVTPVDKDSAPTNHRYLEVSENAFPLRIQGLDPGEYEVVLRKVLSGPGTLYDPQSVPKRTITLVEGAQDLRLQVDLLGAIQFEVTGMEPGQELEFAISPDDSEWRRLVGMVHLKIVQIRTVTSIRVNGSYFAGGIQPGTYKLRVKDGKSKDVVLQRDSVQVVRGEVSTVRVSPR